MWHRLFHMCLHECWILAHQPTSCSKDTAPGSHADGTAKDVGASPLLLEMLLLAKSMRFFLPTAADCENPGGSPSSTSLLHRSSLSAAVALLGTPKTCSAVVVRVSSRQRKVHRCPDAVSNDTSRYL